MSLPALDDLREENERLKRAVEELATLNHLAVEIGTLTSSDEIIAKIVTRSLRAVDAEQGVLTLIDADATHPLRTLVRAHDASRERPRFHFSDALLGWIELHKKPLTVNDPGADERFRGVTWEASVRSLLAVPLMVKSELKAVLTVYNKKGSGGFSESDERLLAILAGQSAQVLENARLSEHEKALAKMREQVRLAALIQQRLLPAAAPEVTGYELAGTSMAAREVGGDYFDFIPVGDERLAVCLGDVSGKGLPASLLMANLQATVRGQTDPEISPGECMARSNRLLRKSSGSSKFVTFFYAVLDPRHHEMVFSNAGHNPPLLFSGDGEPQRLASGGPVLGVLKGAVFDEQTLELRPGDLLVIYSDGIVEALDKVDEEYGEERLVQVIQEHRAAGAGRLVEEVLTAVREHSSGVPQTDDMTLVAVRRQA